METRATRRIRAEAAKWSMVLEDVELSPARWAEFERWRDEDPRHREAYEAIEGTWSEAEMNAPRILERLRARRSAPMYRRMVESLSRAVWTIGMRPRAAVVCLVAVSAVGAAVWVERASVGDGTQTIRFSVAVGHLAQKFSLDDGSTLTLNANSAATVSFSKAHRRVVLEGEALFDVAHDVARPFDVRTGGVVARAMGTRFSMRARGGSSADVLVVQGRVAVRPAEQMPSSAGAAPASVGPVPIAVVEAGYRASVRDVRADDVSIEQVTPTAEKRLLAWTSGRVDLDGRTLREAVEEFNRYNARKLRVEDDAINGQSVGGAFTANRPDRFARQLPSFTKQRVCWRGEAEEIVLFECRGAEWRGE